MELTHFNEQGLARMVDVSEKAQTFRVARAEATVRMAKTTMDKIKEGAIGKGAVGLAVHPQQVQVDGARTCWRSHRSRASWPQRRTASSSQCAIRCC